MRRGTLRGRSRAPRIQAGSSSRYGSFLRQRERAGRASNSQTKKRRRPIGQPAPRFVGFPYFFSRRRRAAIPAAQAPAARMASEGGSGTEVPPPPPPPGGGGQRSFPMMGRLHMKPPLPDA